MNLKNGSMKLLIFKWDKEVKNRAMKLKNYKRTNEVNDRLMKSIWANQVENELMMLKMGR